MYYEDGNSNWNNYEPVIKKVKITTTSTEKYDSHNNLISKEVVTMSEEIIDEVVFVKQLPYQLPHNDQINSIGFNDNINGYNNYETSTSCLIN